LVTDNWVSIHHHSTSSCPGAEYFGVTCRHDYLRRVLKAKRDYGLINNPEMDFPLVTGAQPVHEAAIDRRD
jgi:hypothetical protein